MPTENTITKELHTMDKRLTGLEENISSIDNKLTQVVDAILGNPLTKQGGMIAEMDQMKKDMLALQVLISVLQKKQLNNEKFKNRIIWTIATIIAIGVLLQYVGNFYFKFNK